MARQSEAKNAKTTSRSTKSTRACSSKIESASDCGGKCATRKSSKRSK